ncbi:MAG: hypothetical protein ABSA33_07370 [Candidatus Micrarchaeaceae archaeon]
MSYFPVAYKVGGVSESTSWSLSGGDIGSNGVASLTVVLGAKPGIAPPTRQKPSIKSEKEKTSCFAQSQQVESP